MNSLITLGSLQLTGGSGPILPGRRKVLALLACILRRSPEPVSRAELTRLFWPDRSDTHGKQSLRQALAEIRAVVGDALESDAESVLLDPAACTLDLRQFEEAVRLERWDEAAHLWGGDFLNGLEGVGGDAWVAWLGTERTALRRLAATTFESLLAVAERREERKAAAEWAHKWCDVAPLDERACTARIRALVRLGRPVDAAVCYEAFVRRVHAESHATPSAEFEALRQTFAANRAAPADKVVVRGRVTLSGVAQLSVDARSVAEATAVVSTPARPELLQTISGVTSFSFRNAIQELVEHGIVREAEGGGYEYTSDENRERIYRVISGDRRASLQRAAAQHLAPAPSPAVRAAPRPRAAPRQFRIPRKPLLFAGGFVAVVALVAGVNWAADIATASSLELEAGSTVLLADFRDDADPDLAYAVNTAASVGLKQSRHVAVYTPPRTATPAADQSAHVRDVARREGIPRIISLDIRRTDSVLQVAARLLDGSSGEVLGEETVDTRRTQLVDDLDGLLRRVRVALGENESVVRDSSRPLREVTSPSIDALSSYAEGLSAWGADRRDEARVAWERALEQDSSFALAELALANDAFGREDHASGERWARRAVEHADRLTALDALRARQMVAMREARFDEAVKLATEIATRAPSSDAWFDVASVHEAAGRCADAGTALERAIALDSANTRARLMQLGCAVDQGNTALALRTLDTIQRIDADALSPATAARYRGLALVRAGRLDEADTAFARMRAGTLSDSAYAHRWSAQVAMLRGRYGVALGELQEATRLFRRDGDASDLFANLVLETSAFVAIGGRTRASELIDEAYAVATTRGITAMGYFQVGHLMARIGRINGAREALRVASQRAEPGNEADQWAVRLLTASIHLVERNAPAALETLGDSAAPRQLEPWRLAIRSDANALLGQHDAAAAAAAELAGEWHFGTNAQDEWLRSTLRMARASEATGDTTAARSAYKAYIDRWKDADVFLVELATAQRNFQRLGGAMVVSSTSGRD